MRTGTLVQAIHLSGEGVSSIFLTTSTPKRESGRNYLEVADIDGTHVVRALDVGTLGKSFTFGVTRKIRNLQARVNTAPAIALPVSLGVGSN